MTPNTNSTGNHLDQLREACAKYRTAYFYAPLTTYGYARDWAAFTLWSASHGLTSMPADSETISLYAADMLARGYKITTVRRHVAGIVAMHRSKGLAGPSSKDATSILRGAQRERCEQPRKMEPMSVADLQRIAAVCDLQSLKDCRDRAIVVIGFASALRRSNISALDLGDVEVKPEGLIVSVRKEKQDRRGRIRMVGLPRGKNPLTCPVEALKDWLSHRGMWEGPLFTRLQESRVRLHANWVAQIVKRRLRQVGCDPAGYAGHSLRAGFITEAGENGASELLIAAHTGHRSMEVLRGYFRRRDLWKANAASVIGM